MAKMIVCAPHFASERCSPTANPHYRNDKTRLRPGFFVGQGEQSKKSRDPENCSDELSFPEKEQFNLMLLLFSGINRTDYHAALTGNFYGKVAGLEHERNE